MPKVVSAKDKRIMKAYRLHPKTIEQIKELAEKKQMTQADVIDKALKLLAQ
ncbi:TPA: hypothetical protein QCW56_005116 [Bacillus cereus]|nr:hypothetical protein [Bacillus cereus]HDR8049116.1 hypothetical protein [Bacillus cereus]